MRSIGTALGIVLLAVGLAACGSGESSTAAASNPSTQPSSTASAGPLDGLAAKLGSEHGQVSGAAISADASIAKDLTALKGELARGS